MRTMGHYNTHPLRPESHKRCPSIKLEFENIWNRHYVKIIIPTFSFQTVTISHWSINMTGLKNLFVKKLYNFFHFLHNCIHTSRYNLHCLQYLIYHPDYLMPTSNHLTNFTNQSTRTRTARTNLTFPTSLPNILTTAQCAFWVLCLPSNRTSWDIS